MKPAQDIRSTLQNAMALHQKGDAAQAEKLYRDVLKIMPDEPNALHLLGVLAWQNNDLITAEQNIRKAIRFNNKASAYYNNLGGILRQKGDNAGSVEAYESALKLAPQDENVQRELMQSLHHRAQELTKERHFDEAKAAYSRVLEFHPDNIATLNNLATIIQHQNNRPAALELYDKALKISPDNLLLRYNRGICYLTDQRLPEGWADFTASEPHWRNMQDKRQNLPWMQRPLWDGNDLRGKKILIWGDQGIGDEVAYASMIPELMGRGAIVTIECTDRLVPLFERSFSGITVLPRQTPPLPTDAFDCHAPWMWMARCLRPDMNAFPQQKSFLKADMAKVARLRERYLAFGKKQILGLSWFTGSPAWGLYRSVQLPDMLAPLALKDMLIVDLQYGNTATAWAEAKKHFPDLTVIHDDEVEQFHDMDLYAAQILACDQVLTISNTTSHMAGALGVPAIILMSDIGLTWYWFEKGEACPWYPSLKLLRPSVPDRLKAAANMVANYRIN